MFAKTRAPCTRKWTCRIPAAFCFQACTRKPRSRSKRKTTRSRSPCRRWIRTNNQTSVDVVDSSNKIEVRRIVLGIQTATDAEVLSGLQEGETVVVSDRSGLKAGQPVQPKLINLMQYQGSEEQH